MSTSKLEEGIHTMSANRMELPQDYVDRLGSMSLGEVATEAVQCRSNSRVRPGTATSAILRWVREKYENEQFACFFRLYNQLWIDEKQRRSDGKASRRSHRPVIGRRRPRRYQAA